MNKKLLGMVAAAAVALSLTACSSVSTSGADADAPPAPTAPPEAVVEEGLGGPDDEVAPPPVNDMILGFGETMTWEDGISIAVSPAEPFTPDGTAAGAGANNIVFTITLTNGTQAPYDPFVYGTLSSGGAEASAIFDVVNDIGGGPTTAVLPGQSISWREAYSVVDPASLTYQVSPGSFEYEDAIFTNIAP